VLFSAPSRRTSWSSPLPFLSLQTSGTCQSPFNPSSVPVCTTRVLQGSHDPQGSVTRVSVGRGRGQHLLPLLDPYPPQRVAGFRANTCAILPLLWNRQRIACLLFRKALGSRGPRSGLPLGTVAGVVGFVDGRALCVGAAEEEGRGSRGVLLSELGRFCSARHAACVWQT
jgi:hypothetical protein